VYTKKLTKKMTAATKLNTGPARHRQSRAKYRISVEFSAIESIAAKIPARGLRPGSEAQTHDHAHNS
jgi:hypothetical protein